MERTKEFEAFVRDLMPEATPEELEVAMQHLDDYVRFLMRLAERMERAELDQIRRKPGEEV